MKAEVADLQDVAAKMSSINEVLALDKVQLNRFVLQVSRGLFRGTMGWYFVSGILKTSLGMVGQCGYVIIFFAYSQSECHGFLFSDLFCASVGYS